MKLSDRKIILACLLSLTAPIVTLAQASRNIPAQYIAKLYTEALGRGPSQSEWTKSVAYFNSNGCSVNSLQAFAKAIYASPEYAADYTDPQAQAMTVYRALLSRDPSDEELSASSGAKGAGVDAMVGSVFQGPEFAKVAATLCGNTARVTYSAAAKAIYEPNYSWLGSKAPPRLTTASKGVCPTEDQLQGMIASAGRNGTVTLAQKCAVAMGTTLTVNNGVTLTTYGSPKPTQYAIMARLYRTGVYPGPIVHISSGAHLANVWVDGQISIIGRNRTSGANVSLFNGNGNTVEYVKSSDAQSGSNFSSQGTQQHTPCSNGVVRYNLLTGYSSEHGYKFPTDGMTMGCESLDIENNTLVDMTDVNILLLGSVTVPNTSTVANNTIIQAGNIANAAISIDQITANALPTGSQTICYTAKFVNNTFWTGPDAAFVFAVGNGARQYFQVNPKSGPSRLVDATCPGNRGPSYTNNGTGSLSANVREGIAIAGVLNSTIAVNTDGAHPFKANVITLPDNTPGSKCPGELYVAEEGHSSGGTYSGFTPKMEPASAIDFCTLYPGK